jgi:hypothetical protein
MLHLANEHFQPFLRACQGSGELLRELVGHELELLMAIHAGRVYTSLNRRIGDM